MRTHLIVPVAFVVAATLVSPGVRADLQSARPSRPDTTTYSAPPVNPAPATPYLWAAPNKLTVGATLEKVKAEDGPAWEASVGAPSDAVAKRVAEQEGHLDRKLSKSILFHVETHRKIIALTFDDGPHAGWTTKLIAELKDLDVPATFFVVGKQVEKFPDLAHDISAAGFTIGNHTYDHVSLLKIPSEYVPTELLACGTAVKTVVGATPRFFRPPGGEFDRNVANTAAELGYETVLWTDDPGDFASPPADVIVKRTLAHATPGGIVLMHDGIPNTLEALPKIVAALKLQGYEFVDLDELNRERDQGERSVVMAKHAPVMASYTTPAKLRATEPKTEQYAPLRPGSATEIVH